MDPATIPDDVEIGARTDRKAKANGGAQVSRHAVVLGVEGKDKVGREGEDRLLLPELLDEITSGQAAVDVERLGFELQAAGARGPSEVTVPLSQAPVVEASAGVRAAIAQGPIGTRVGLRAPALKVVGARRDGDTFRHFERDIESIELGHPVRLEMSAGRGVESEREGGSVPRLRPARVVGDVTRFETEKHLADALGPERRCGARLEDHVTAPQPDAG